MNNNGNNNAVSTVIMAGGKGTRIASVASDIPKPMIPVLGRPILEYQIDCLKKNGFSEIMIITGHLGGHIHNYFGDGSGFGCSIHYFDETEPLGTAGALFKIRQNLKDNILLLHGDLIFDMDLNRLLDFHISKNAPATITTHPNNHPFDSSLINYDENCRVCSWIGKDEKRLYYKNRVNAGIHVISRKTLDMIQREKDKVDLDSDILKPLAAKGGLFAYNTPEYIKDMGTPERYKQVSDDIENGIVKSKNLAEKQKAVFLDRDGTINKSKGFISKPADFELIENAGKAIGMINKAGWLAIVITNQPVIARGEASFEELALIHDKMETELGKSGAYLDDIFFCPHHPDKGFAGERPEYKTDCDCRKPKPGMLLAAAKKFNIDLKASFMVGDDEKDVLAGNAAGCKSILLGKDFADLYSFAMKYFNENIH